MQQCINESMFNLQGTMRIRNEEKRKGNLNLINPKPLEKGLKQGGINPKPLKKGLKQGGINPKPLEKGL
jgi:hypothetical protein